MKTKNYTIENFTRWDDIVDYESDEDSVTLINSKGKKVAEYGYREFTKMDFDQYKTTNMQTVDKGAHFSDDRKYRYALWRIWDKSLPLVMFIGLNPSTANEDENDPTIRRVQSIAKYNGYGGFYMMNCFPFVSTDPTQMLLCQPKSKEWNINELCLWEVGKKCKDVVFAWGNFDVVEEMGRDRELTNLFPNAKALHINKSGSPKHPLYCKEQTLFVNWSNTTIKLNKNDSKRVKTKISNRAR